MPSPRISTAKGFTLIEIIVTMAIMAMSFLFFSGLNMSMAEKFSLETERVAKIAELEERRNARMANRETGESSADISFEIGSGLLSGPATTIPISFGQYESLININADGSIE